jgi:hypothetical protein
MTGLRNATPIAPILHHSNTPSTKSSWAGRARLPPRAGRVPDDKRPNPAPNLPARAHTPTRPNVPPVLLGSSIPHPRPAARLTTTPTRRYANTFPPIVDTPIRRHVSVYPPAMGKRGDGKDLKVEPRRCERREEYGRSSAAGDRAGKSLFVALHSRPRCLFHFFLNVVICAWTCSAGMVRPERIEFIPCLILSRTSAFQTSSRCFKRRRPSRTTSLAVS